MSPRLLRPLATGFNPRQIAGLVGWWDASDSSTVTLDSGRVAGLADKSGNGRDATNAVSGSTQPDYIEGGRNGKNVARYVTADQTQLEIPSTDVPASFTAFHVLWRPTAGTLSVGLGSATTRPYTVLWFTDNIVYHASNAGFTSHGSGGTATGGFLLTTRRTGTTSVLVRQDGALLSDVTTGAGITNPATGAWTRLGQYSSEYMQGDLAEIVLYSGSLSDSDVARVEGYLAWRWGLQAQLPYDHPYARSFPGFGSQATPTDADTLTYLAAVKAADGTGVEVGVANAVDDFVKGTKADGTWDAIKASCILAGARTLAGALVPLKPLGPELWSVSTPSITDFGGSSGAWDGSTLTMSNSVVGTNAGYPRFSFSLPLTIGKRYAVTGTLTGDISAIVTIRLAASGSTSNVSYDSGTGVFSATNVPAGAALLEFAANGTLAFSVSIADLSIRETSAPTNNNFTASDYNRETGLVGDGSTTYLDSNRVGTADGQNDRHRSLYVTASPSTSPHAYMGHTNTGSSQFDDIYNASTTSYIRPCTSGGSLNSATGTGLLGYSRTSSASVDYIIFSSSSGSSTASVAPLASTALIFGSNEAAGPGRYTDARLAFYSIGESLDLAALDARVSALITAIGNAI
jgi:hypothetical protein